MLFNNAQSKINVRASYNDIELIDYIGYPVKTQREILYALEKGCTKEQVDHVLRAYSVSSFSTAIEKVIGIPDVESYTKILEQGLNSVPLPDLRDTMKEWELLLPLDTGGHSWNSSQKGLTIENIKRNIEETDVTISDTFVFLTALDHFIKANGETNILSSVCNIWEKVSGEVIEYDSINEVFTFEKAEVIAQYFAICGKNPKDSIRLCGIAMKEFSFSTRQTYHLMLETATLIVAIQSGILAGYNFFSTHKLSTRYEICEVGIWNKKISATPIADQLLITAQILDMAKRGKECWMQQLLKNNPSRSLLLIKQIFSEAVLHVNGLNDLLQIPYSVKQYIKEISFFIRKEK